MIQNVMLGCGVLMTVGLFFIFRSLIRQVRAESRANPDLSRKNED